MASSGWGERDAYRSLLHGDEEKNTAWRYGAPPNYDVVNKLFEQGRTKIWPAGSMEAWVQNLVKTWEMEFFHKTSIEDFKTLDPKKYTLSINGRKGLNMEEIKKLGGGYNPLLQTSMPEKLRGYDPETETAESSHRTFTTVFPRGFAFEILQLYSGPPLIVYKFRHWGFMEGPFKSHAPTSQMIEFFGIAIFELDGNQKIVKVEFFYDPAELIGGLMKGVTLTASANRQGGGEEEAASTCPILRNTG